MRDVLHRFTVCFAVAVLALCQTAPALGDAFIPRDGFGRTVPHLDTYFASHGHLFACDSGAMVVYDTNMAVVATVNLPGKIEDTEVIAWGETPEKFALLAASNLGLLIYDIEDPADPKLVDAWRPVDGRVRGVTASGIYAYCVVLKDVGGVEIRTVRLTDKVVTNVFTPSGSNAIAGFWHIEAVETSIVYPSPSSTFTVLDIQSTPQAPTLAGTFGAAGAVRALTGDPSSSKIHLALGGALNGIQVFDLSNPASPVNNGATGGLTWGANSIAVQGNYAHVAVGGTSTQGRIAIYDVAASPPVLLSQINSGNIAMNSAAVAGNLMMCGGANNVLPDETRFFNVANKSAPFFVGSRDIAAFSEGVYVVGDYLYAAVGHDGLWIADISDPDNPVEVGSADSGFFPPGPFPPGEGNLAENIWVSDDGNYAFCSEGNWTAVYDTSNKSAPTTVFAHDYGGWQEGIRLKGNHLYVFSHGPGGNPGGCTLIDASNPANLVQLDRFNIVDPHKPKDGFVDANDYVYIAATRSLIILRRNGNTLRHVATFDIQSQLSGYAQTEIWDVEKHGDYLFCSSKRPGGSSSVVGLIVFDVSNPANPQHVTTMPVAGNGFEGVWIDDGICYLSHGYTTRDGITAVDISNPANPFVIDTIETGDTNLNVHVRDGRVYSAGFRCGIPIVDFVPAIFTDDFSGSLANWTQDGGTWGIQSGELFGSDLGFAGGRCIASGTAGAKKIETMIRPLSAGGGIGLGFVIFDYIDAANMKFAAIYALANEVWIGEVIGGAIHIRTVKSETINFDQDYEVKVDFFDRMAVVSIDGVKTASYFLGLVNGGSAGVGVFGSICAFDDFTVH